MAETSEVRTTVGGRVLTLTNLDKVLFPEVGYTKAEVIAYYAEIAPVLLPHLRDRVVTRVRFPGGVADPASFYEKNPPPGSPDWVRTVPVLTSDGLVTYVVAEDEATVVWLANLAALELHAPQWTISSATPAADGVVRLPGDSEAPGEPRANRVVVDLDPGAGVTMEQTCRAALLVAARMAADGLVPVPQTSGSKGVQVYAAVRPVASRDVWAYVKHLNRTFSRAHPDLFVATMSVAQRAGRVYLDYNQNLASRNTISPYSLRGRARPYVATPLRWEEVAEVAAGGELRFGPEEVLARVAEHGDLATDLLSPDRPALPGWPS